MSRSEDPCDIATTCNHHHQHNYQHQHNHRHHQHHHHHHHWHQQYNNRRNSSGGGGGGGGRSRSTARVSSRCIFLIVTIVITATASGLIVLALMTDHWVYIDFDRTRVAQVAANDTQTQVQWLMGGKVARISSPASTVVTASPILMTAQLIKSMPKLKRVKRTLKTTYLVPKYSGVWTICINLNEDERRELTRMGYDRAWCKQFLSPEFLAEGPNEWMTRLQNLSISCSTVGLILLGTAALVGLFGVVKRQISAVLVTGVMYILAAVFCLFTLFIIQFKRKASSDCHLSDPTIPLEYRRAQVTTTGWSLAVGWIGVPFCAVAAILWYILSKILRYGHITQTHNSRPIDGS